MTSSPFGPKSGQRLADQAIYQGQDPNQAPPKEYFKLIGDRLAQRLTPQAGPCADVGCANGALLAYLHQRFPQLTLHGYDVVPQLIQEARHHLPKLHFETASILDHHALPKETFQFVICAGTVQIFDDLAQPLANLLQMLKPGGVLWIMTLANRRDVDLITRYRRADQTGAPWEQGWNIFSRTTYANTLTAHPAVQTLTWHEFQMPFAIPPVQDPMRSWTTATADHDHQLLNGAGLLLDPVLIEVTLNPE